MFLSSNLPGGGLGKVHTGEALRPSGWQRGAAGQPGHHCRPQPPRHEVNLQPEPHHSRRIRDHLPRPIPFLRQR